MAEPSAVFPPGVMAPGRDALLATKFHVPRSRPEFVLRPRLVEALDEGLSRQLILVCAPAGFGKTALLADWARSGDRPVAWLSLDAADNDPARFWRHVVAALDRALPRLGARVEPLVGPPAPSSFEGLVTALVNELAARPAERGVLLVLDDYHVIDTGSVHASLESLLTHLPPGTHLVVATRSDPPLPLARLRARGQLAELRAGDLRFTADEAASMLRETTGDGLPATAATALADRTEGWAAGLHLAALSLRGHTDVGGFVAAFSGSHRYVLDYLTAEVLDGLDEQVRGFLLETSVLDRLSAELCDAVTGRTDSQAMLERVERSGLFLVPLDDVRRWWRYHQLFADLLRARLRQQRPARIAVLHRAAAAWHEEHGLADDAVRHALDAGDAVRAARVVERHADALIFLQGEGATVQRWLAALPAEVTGSRPRLLMTQVALDLLSRRIETVEGLLDAAGRAFAEGDEGDEEHFEPALGRDASLLTNLPATMALGRAALAQIRGDDEGTAAFGRQALAEVGPGEWLLEFIIRGYLARADWLCGRLVEAERALSWITGRLQRGGASTYVAWGSDYLGQVQRALGRLDAAADTYRRAFEINASDGRPILPAAGLGYVGLAEIAYQRDELDAALRYLDDGIPLCRQFVSAPPLAAALATLAWIRQARGDTARALEVMDEAARVAADPAVPSLLNPVPAQRARLLLAQGDVAAAARWIEQRGLSPDEPPAYQREPEYLVLARVLLAQGDAGAALALLARLYAQAAAQDRTGSIVEIQALRALASAAGGDEDAAVDTLAEALTLARPQGYVRIFADEDTPMAALLARVAAAQKADRSAARGVEFGYLARVLRAVGGDGRDAAVTAPGLVDQLTPREHEVLVLLAAGTPNPRIAAQLVVTLDTVKKHVSHVLSKLGAANRTEAVTRARQLGLIP